MLIKLYVLLKPVTLIAICQIQLYVDETLIWDLAGENVCLSPPSSLCFFLFFIFLSQTPTPPTHTHSHTHPHTHPHTHSQRLEIIICIPVSFTSDSHYVLATICNCIQYSLSAERTAERLQPVTGTSPDTLSVTAPIRHCHPRSAEWTTGRSPWPLIGGNHWIVGIPAPSYRQTTAARQISETKPSETHWGRMSFIT